MTGSAVKDPQIILRGTVGGKSTEVKLADVPNPKDYGIEELAQKIEAPATGDHCSGCHGMASSIGSKVGD